MLLFIIEKNQVLPAPHTLLVSEFKQVWESDKSKDKSQALKELGYVYYVADYKSVYQSTPPEEREQVIKDDLLLKEDWKPSTLVLAAIEKYKQLQVTASMRFLDSQIYALEKSIEYFKSIDYTRTDSKGKFVYDIQTVTRSMKESAGVLDSLEKIKQRVKQELDTKGKIRGSGEMGLYEE